MVFKQETKQDQNCKSVEFTLGKKCCNHAAFRVCQTREMRTWNCCLFLRTACCRLLTDRSWEWSFADGWDHFGSFYILHLEGFVLVFVWCLIFGEHTFKLKTKRESIFRILSALQSMLVDFRGRNRASRKSNQWLEGEERAFSLSLALTLPHSVNTDRNKDTWWRKRVEISGRNASLKPNFHTDVRLFQ